MALVLVDGVWEVRTDNKDAGVFSSASSVIVSLFGEDVSLGNNVNFFVTGSATGSF